MDLYSSSIISIEGFKYSAVFTDSFGGFRWQYGLKTKDENLAVAKRWFAEIADLQENYPLLMVVRDNSGENKSKELCDFFTEHGVKNYYSTPYEQWQNGLAESSIKSITMLGKTVMAESGLGGPYWFCATTHSMNCRNATYSKRLGMTPHEKMYGTKKDVSKFRPIGCRGYMHLNQDRREPGRHAPRGQAVINLGWARDRNTSGYKLLVEATGKVVISNQVKFDESLYQYRNRVMIDKHIDDLMEVDILTPEPGQYQWIQYNADTDLNEFEKVHSGGSSDSYILRSIAHPNVCMRVKRDEFFQSLLAKRSDELLVNARALVARMGLELPGGDERDSGSKVKGLPASVDPSKPPKSFKDAMRGDRELWAEAYDKEYQGFV